MGRTIQSIKSTVMNVFTSIFDRTKITKPKEKSLNKFFFERGGFTSLSLLYDLNKADRQMKLKDVKIQALQQDVRFYQMVIRAISFIFSVILFYLYQINVIKDLIVVLYLKYFSALLFKTDTIFQKLQRFENPAMIEKEKWHKVIKEIKRMERFSQEFALDLPRVPIHLRGGWIWDKKEKQ